MTDTPYADALKGLRNQSITFEAVISGLTCEIGRVERLTDLTPDQINRLRQAVIRLSNAKRKASYEA